MRPNHYRHKADQLQLRIPMRGYEPLLAALIQHFASVTNPHAGL